MQRNEGGRKGGNISSCMFCDNDMVITSESMQRSSAQTLQPGCQPLWGAQNVMPLLEMSRDDILKSILP